jgi:hypothetical protein
VGHSANEFEIRDINMFASGCIEASPELVLITLQELAMDREPWE